MKEPFNLLETGINVKSFLPKPVPDEVLLEILHAGKLAHSREGAQPWKFYVVSGEELKKELASAAYNQGFVAQAPVLIVVCADLDLAERIHGKKGRDLYAIQDSAAACQNMVMAARILDLKVTWVSSFHERRVARLLGIDIYSLYPSALLAMGYSDERGERLALRPDEEVIVHIEERQDIVRRL